MRTPIYATERHRGERGFTLVELIAVLTILALVAAAFSYRSQSSFGTAKFRALMSNTAAALREARSDAVATAGDRLFLIDVKGRHFTYKEGNIDIVLPPGVELAADTAQSETLGTAAVIRFYPDGSSTGGVLHFDWNGRNSRIDVNWLTGNVEMHGL